jgi:hypothetical protein
MTKEEFAEKLQAVIAEMGVKTLRQDDDALNEYCRLTGHDPAVYRERDRLPVGYLLTFIDPIVTQIIVSFFIKFPGTIKGVIHSSSTVRVMKPLSISAREYKEEFALRNIEEKSGKKGKYLVTDFEVALMDAGGEQVASDLHQFFLKI